MKGYFLAIAIVLFCFAGSDVNAASLTGRVIEVNSGDVFTIFNLNRPVRVKLLGVDAPELNQAFGDVAKKHLSDLVFDKSVLVVYSGIASDSSLTGRVLLENSDIGAQMIRDGAAWFDPNGGHRLNPDDRDVYQQSEQAARSERRGLWQAENPTAPWEFVKAEQLRLNPVASLNAILPAQKARAGGPVPELTNLTLIAARNSARAPQPRGRSVSSADFAGVAPAERGDWRVLKPNREHFSVLVPVAGDLTTMPLGRGDREVVTNVYRARDGWSIYGVVWLKGPTLGESDTDAIKQSLTRLLEGFGQGFEENTAGRSLPNFSCELENEKDISTAGFAGLEFDLKSCTIPTRARVFTRIVDDERQMYVATVFYLEEDDNVARFIKSFTITPTQKAKSRKRN